MRVFIADLGSTLGKELLRYCQDADIEVVGTTATKAQLAVLKRRVQEHASSDKPGAVTEPIALATDKAAWSRLIRASSVVITSLVADTKRALEMLKVHEQPRDENDENDADGADESNSVKKFIALSNVLAWSKSPAYAKASGPDGQGPVPHRERDFKTRKPARPFAELKAAETQILSANRPDDAFETIVVGAGLVYGGAQTNLLLLFRNAWLSSAADLRIPSLLGDSKAGANHVPMISVYDLALVLFRLATAASSASLQQQNYVLAVDHASRFTTLRDVCMGLSILLGNGHVCALDSPDDAAALLVDGADDMEDDAGLVAPLQLDLCFDTTEAAMHEFVAADEWRFIETGLLGNLQFFVADFLTSFDVRPVRLLVLGPPQVGKTTLSGKVARASYVQHITLASLVDEVSAAAVMPAVTAVTPLQEQEHEQQQADNGDDTIATSAAVSGESMAPVDDKNATSTSDASELQQLQTALRDWRSANTTADDNATDMTSSVLYTLPDDIVVALLRWKLQSAACRNQGYVLDGIPLSAAQAASAFEPQETGDSGGDGSDSVNDPDGDSGANDSAAADDAAADEKTNDDDDAPPNRVAARVKAIALLLATLRRHAAQYRPVAVPNRVVVLQAPRELLEARAQQLADDVAAATDNTQAAFDRRYEVFTTEIDALTTLLERVRPTQAGEQQTTNTSDGIEVLELHLEDEHAFQDAAQLDDVVWTYVGAGQGQNCTNAPTNFRPTPAERRQLQRELVARRELDDARNVQLVHELDAQQAAAAAARLAAERTRLELLQREETALLEARAKPLRTFLMDTVLPALTEGMLEVVSVQPADPIDYLAEFLFRKGREMDDNVANADCSKE